MIIGLTTLTKTKYLTADHPESKMWSWYLPTVIVNREITNNIEVVIDEGVPLTPGN